MSKHRSSLEPIQDAKRSLRSRLGWKGELVLATAPTLAVLAGLAMIEAVTRQRLLFASLAASAFLIYLVPQHSTKFKRR